LVADIKLESRKAAAKEKERLEAEQREKERLAAEQRRRKEQSV
jgi:hypothetical protein